MSELATGVAPKMFEREPKRRCDYCHRAVATTDHLTGAVVFGIHSPPGGGYCPNSEQPVPTRKLAT